MPKSLTWMLMAVGLVLVPTAPAVSELLLVANKSDDTVDFVDLERGESLATLATGHAPHEIAVSADGRIAVVSNYGDRESAGSTLTVLDVPGARVVRTVELEEHTRPHGLVFISGSKVAVTTEGSGHLLLVDVATGAIVEAVATGQRVSHMLAVTPDGARAFVANIGSNNVTAIDLDSASKLRDIETGEGAEGIAVAPDGSEVWVGNRESDTLSVIDPTSLAVLATLPCPGFPIRLTFTPDGESVLVSAARSGEVVVFDRHGRTEVRRAALDLSNAPDASRRLFGDRFGDSPVPVGLVVSPTARVAWVAATQADAVVVVDPETLEVMDLIRAGREPDGMAYSPVSLEQIGSPTPTE